jgi:hypothetical protein
MVEWERGKSPLHCHSVRRVARWSDGEGHNIHTCALSGNGFLGHSAILSVPRLQRHTAAQRPSHELKAFARGKPRKLCQKAGVPDKAETKVTCPRA